MLVAILFRNAVMMEVRRPVRFEQKMLQNKTRFNRDFLATCFLTIHDTLEPVKHFHCLIVVIIVAFGEL